MPVEGPRRPGPRIARLAEKRRVLSRAQYYYASPGKRSTNPRGPAGASATVRLDAVIRARGHENGSAPALARTSTVTRQGAGSGPVSSISSGDRNLVVIYLGLRRRAAGDRGVIDDSAAGSAAMDWMAVRVHRARVSKIGGIHLRRDRRPPKIDEVVVGASFTAILRKPPRRRCGLSRAFDGRDLSSATAQLLALWFSACAGLLSRNLRARSCSSEGDGRLEAFDPARSSVATKANSLDRSESLRHKRMGQNHGRSTSSASMKHPAARYGNLLGAAPTPRTSVEKSMSQPE